jgi:demethylmenaquinone methyltransferase / 2-methoxy-6-polyprenyl-1,4-benzoquinol methylase
LHPKIARGTTPEGAATDDQASRWVRDMFGRVAHRYDLANHLLSFNIDRLWRSRTVAEVRAVLTPPGARVLDLCCGTGDLLMALESSRGAACFGSDFCHPMLTAARAKLHKHDLRSKLFESDALRLPVRDASLDLVTVAFGFRNLVNYDAGLVEMRRVLRPGGIVAILEFSQPRNPAFAALYGFYSRRILPVIGGAISGARDAYTYLPESVRKFPDAPALADRMRAAGFQDVRFIRMTFGIVALHLGRV